MTGIFHTISVDTSIPVWSYRTALKQTRVLYPFGFGLSYTQVLYPFGFGLSYTSFSYKWSDGAADQGGHVTPLNTANLVAAAASAPSSTASAAVSHQVVVTNTGSVVGDCVVMGFAVSAENYQGSNRDRAGAFLKLRPLLEEQSLC